jgi:hypothetical protein
MMGKVGVWQLLQLQCGKKEKQEWPVIRDKCGLQNTSQWNWYPASSHQPSGLSNIKHQTDGALVPSCSTAVSRKLNQQSVIRSSASVIQ